MAFRQQWRYGLYQPDIRQTTVFPEAAVLEMVHHYDSGDIYFLCQY